MLVLYTPEKTITAPIHCRELKVLPKNITDVRTVKNFLVVVTTEHANGPNWETWRNISVIKFVLHQKYNILTHREENKQLAQCTGYR